MICSSVEFRFAYCLIATTWLAAGRISSHRQDYSLPITPYYLRLSTHFRHAWIPPHAPRFPPRFTLAIEGFLPLHFLISTEFRLIQSPNPSTIPTIPPTIYDATRCLPKKRPRPSLRPPTRLPARALFPVRANLLLQGSIADCVQSLG